MATLVVGISWLRPVMRSGWHAEHRRRAAGVAALAVDPETVEVVRVRHGEVGGDGLVVAGDALRSELFGVALVGEDHFADGG